MCNHIHAYFILMRGIYATVCIRPRPHSRGVWNYILAACGTTSGVSQNPSSSPSPAVSQTVAPSLLMPSSPGSDLTQKVTLPNGGSILLPQTYTHSSLEKPGTLAMVTTDVSGLGEGLVVVTNNASDQVKFFDDKDFPPTLEQGFTDSSVKVVKHFTRYTIQGQPAVFATFTEASPVNVPLQTVALLVKYNNSLSMFEFTKNDLNIQVVEDRARAIFATFDPVG